MASEFTPRASRLFSGPMAITAEAARDLRERMAAASDPAFMSEIAGRFRAQEPSDPVDGTGGILRIDDGIGVITISGPLFKSSGSVDDWIRSFLGCTSYDDIWRAIEKCRETSLKGAIVRWNSPGGDVGGLGELADHFYSLRDEFPVWSYVETQCASAAVWIATQTEKIVAHETSLVGWIGVIRGPLLDDSKFLEEHGFRLVEIVSKHAKQKRTIPLDDEVLSRFQVMADDLGDRFEAAVARGRDVTAEVVANDFGQGDGMIAGKAKNAGLIDEIGSFNSTLRAFREYLSAAPTIAVPQPAASAHAPASTTTGEQTMALKAESEEKKDDKAKAEGDQPEMVECEKCGGSGKNADGAQCKHCAGEGEVEKAESDGDETAQDKEPDGDEDEKKALASLSGLRASASIAAHTAAIDAKMVPRSKLTALETKVNAMDAERKAEKQAAEDARLNAVADRAGELGYFAGLKGDDLKAKRDRFIRIARNEPDAAEEIIASLPAAKVGHRQTSQGAPAGGRHSSTPRIDAFDSNTGGRRVTHGDVDTIEKGSPDLMVRAKAYAKENKVSIEEGMLAVVKADPSLMQ